MRPCVACLFNQFGYFQFLTSLCCLLLFHFFLSAHYFAVKRVFQSIKAGGQSDKLLEIHAHTEFLIVYILVPEKKPVQDSVAGCAHTHERFSLKKEKKSSVKSPLPW